MRMGIIEQFLRDIFRAEMNPLHASSSVHLDPESRNLVWKFKKQNKFQTDKEFALHFQALSK